MHDRQKKYNQLRVNYPFLIYEGFQIHKDTNLLLVEYSFNLSDKIKFNPRFSIESILMHHEIPESLLNNLLFHIGMAELLSYWKSTCSPEIIIKPYLLGSDALDWWKHLFYHGLGEFFHANRIKPDKNSFVSFKCEARSGIEKTAIDLKDASLIPMGGGKDSAVTLEIMALHAHHIKPFFLNPTRAALEVAEIAGFDKNQSIIIKRIIDPELLRLNDAGFLNGHTPFSALLAFYTLFASATAGFKNIILSNESSANEPTIPGSEINHQYSKSYAFENDFRAYCRNYISHDFNYFSFLRPLNELQIAGLFSGFSKYHSTFRSCNVGSKLGIWCGKCPKCLFTYIILSPYLDPCKLNEIFGVNLLNDSDLTFYFNQLCGLEEEKPFDCIGTVDEVNAALHAAIRKYGSQKLPLLLQQYTQSRKFGLSDESNMNQLLTQFNNMHFIPNPLIALIKNYLYERFF